MLKDQDKDKGEGLKDTFMYKLSKEGHLSQFDHFLLAQSDEDGQNLPECAHLIPSPELMKTKQWKEVTGDMLDNLTQSINDKRVHRITVDFVIKHKRVDKMIGRAAHIQFIENPYFVKMLAYN